jgi:pimeloyl-ACP methyl ester carboxylesterase
MLLLLLHLALDSTLRVPIPAGPAESLNVTISGAGPPVVLLPGLFGAAFGFRKVTGELAQAGYRTAVIEPLGIGSSARPGRADYSLTAQAARVAAVLDQLGIRDAVLVAHSVGASIAFRLAISRPDLVRGIVSIDGGPTESVVTPGLRQAVEYAPWIKLLGGARLLRRQLRKEMAEGSVDPAWVTDSVVAGYTAGAARNLDATLKAYLRMTESREPYRLAPRLVEVRCPVLLLVGGGRRRGGLPTREVDLLARSIVNFAVDTLPGIGHYIHEESPDAVVTAVRRLTEAV